ncbi:MAG: metal-dependent hydrolase [Anaerolineaceae bacterium]|nr:metal-dependent hydrolase [Anaerolineaceae bacterium]
MPKIDQIIRSKRKTIALVVQTDGKLIVRAPLRTTKKDIEQLVQQQEDWILKKQAEMLIRAKQNQPRLFVEKEEFYYLGHLYPLMIVNQALETLKFEKNTFRMTASLQPYGAQVFKEWYRVQAKRILTERVAYYAKKHGFQYKKVRITSASSRWGSYSTSGTLSFPWRLVMAPIDMIDYVVVHELVHSRFQNHSKDFWNGVAAIMPDYKERRKWFKLHGSQLFLGGVK